jgi:hypothetical protein
MSRLVIPVWQESNLGGSKTEKNRIPEDFFFSCVFRRNFSQERGFGRGRRNSCFWPLTQEFFAGIPVGQEFMYLHRIPPDSCSRKKQSGLDQRLKKALC